MKSEIRKDLLILSVLAVIVLFVAACKGVPSDNKNNSESNVSMTVSVYDAEMNPVGKYSFTSASDNTLDMTKFAKTGYNTIGIYDLSSDIMLFNANGFQSPSVLIDKDYTAVVKYSPISYRLIFEAGEGQLVNPVEYVKTLSYAETVGIFPDAEKTGMDFDGWFDEEGNRFSSGTSPIYIEFTDKNYNVSSETIRLYARYKTRYLSVSLIYGNGEYKELQVAYGQKLPDLSEYYKDNGSSIVVGFGVSYSATTVFDEEIYTDMELYAIWRDYKTANFVYTADDVRLLKIFRDGDKAVMPDAGREGYAFDGWYLSDALAGTKVTNVTFGNVAETYYAKWLVAEYEIKFIADGKVIGSSTFTIEEQNIIVPPVPTKKHYTGKWEDYKIEYKDMIVNAIYEPEDMKITLMNGYDYSYVTVKYGEPYSLSVPKKTGYTFIGWYRDGTAITDKDGNTSEPYEFDDDVTLTAEWEPTKCVLYFQTNGGTPVDSVTVEYGTRYMIAQSASKDGFYFGGWFDDLLVNEYINGIVLTGDTVVYAKWLKSTAVSDVEGLKAIANNQSGNFHLTSNINLRGNEWTPIEKFNGILDGNGYKIYNFSLNRNGVDSAFIINNAGMIKNLAFSDIEISDTIDGGQNYSVSAVCAYNTGNLVRVTVKNVFMSVNFSGTNFDNTLSIGMIAGENSGTIAFCSSDSELIYKENLSVSLSRGTRTTYVYIGGIVGKDSGSTYDVKSSFFVDANEYVYVYTNASSIENIAIKEVFLHIGGIVGAEYGSLKNSDASVSYTFYSNAAGSHLNYYSQYKPARYTYIAGAAGGLYDGGSVEECYTSGDVNLTRVGLEADRYELYGGGIIGKISGGILDNCASGVNVVLKDGYCGAIGGIVGCILNGGKASNVFYSGNISTENYLGGYFGGLAGRIEGTLTKGYFYGKITTESTKAADIAGYVENTGMLTKTIARGNIKTVASETKGALSGNYVIDVDYGSDILFDRAVIFDQLCLFESDLWSIDEENGLYLIFFYERTVSEA